jgi:ATP-dependent HslUV protease, peptidase subunit HslV
MPGTNLRRDARAVMPTFDYALHTVTLCMHQTHATTILSVRHSGTVALGGDGQVTLDKTIIKSDACKVRSLAGGKVLVGFAGGVADAFALMERFEGKLSEHPANLPRAATELAKEWRSDRALRRLEALLIAIDARYSLLVSGTGEVIQPTDGIIGIGSGGHYAVAAARALTRHSQLSAGEIVQESLAVAGELDIYSGGKVEMLELSVTD